MPKGTREVVFSFDESHLTHFRGMRLLQQFCQRLRLRARLEQYVRTGPRVSDYPVILYASPRRLEVGR